MTKAESPAIPDTGSKLFVNKKVSVNRIDFALIAVALITLISSWWYSLPQPLFSTPYSSILLDQDNQLLEARIASDEQWRFPPNEALPDSYVKALLLFEDKRFYSHSGVDWLALGRATVQNIQAKKIVSGASTISMQVIRLANSSINSPSKDKDSKKRTLTTKLIESLQALRLEFTYDKQKILNLYASHAPFGGNVVGISAASWRYFGRAPASLSWAESALLAVLPNRPNYLRPGKNQLKLKQKRDRLLTRLKQAGEFDQLELDLALSEPLPDKILAFPKRAPHLLETLITKTAAKKAAKKTAKDTPPSVIKTSLNSNLQAQVQSVVNNYAKRLLSAQITHLAAVVMDNKTGLPIAYIGNSGFNHSPHSGKGIDLLHRPRSTGSILKPLLYATMLQQGEITPLQLVEDTPTKFKGYQPENYDLKFRGVVPAKKALAQSLNIPAVNMLKQHGIKPFYDFLTNRGMSTLHRTADEYGLPLILGGAEGTLWEMTNLYMQLARAAQSLPPQAISHLPGLPLADDPTGSDINSSDLSAGSAWLTLKALLEVGRPGDESRWRQFSNSRKVAWKTGTSYGFRDGWAIGTTVEYTIGVWTGNAEGGGIPGLTGTQAAAPLLFELFNLMPKTHWFSKPEYDLRQARVCKKDGFLATPYCDSKVIDLPLASSYSKTSPYHLRIHTDSNQNRRVSSACEPVHKISAHNWFNLPPHIAFYYQKYHSEYRPMPKWRQDCLNFMSAQSPISFIYPHQGTQVYLPVTMTGKRTKMVSELAHQYAASQVYWYLDQQYLGKTQQIHQMEMGPGLGKHELLVVDEEGNQQVMGFEVLSQ